MTNVEFHLQLNHNETWNMSRLHFHDHFELMLPLTSPGNIFVNDQVYPLQRGTLYLIGENTLHRTITTGFHARYVLHISRKALTELSTPQTDFTQLTRDAFRRAALGADQMTAMMYRVNYHGVYVSTSTNPENGFMSGDLIISVNGAEVGDYPSLAGEIGKLTVGDTAVVEVMRAGEKLTLHVPVIESVPAMVQAD